MSILDKFKKGVSDTSYKAKVMVDVTKARGEITQVEKEIALIYTEIGENYYKGISNDKLEQLTPLLTELCNKIISKQKLITNLKEHIMELNDEKECSCGAVVAYDTKFCPSCGNAFEVSEDIRLKRCPICNNQIEADSRFCGNCGNQV